MPAKRWVVVWMFPGLLAACGGGGGDGDAPPVVLPLPTGRVEGTVRFVRALSPIATEREPNDTVDNAQLLADGFIGDTRSAFGRLDVPGGDTVDAFRMRIPQRARVHVVLNYADVGREFSLSLYDPVSMQFVASATGSTPQFDFTFQGTLDFVVTGVTGAGSYDLAFALTAPSNPSPESEPNDDALEANLAGEVPLGDTVSINGELFTGVDVTDSVLVMVPDTATISLTVTQPELADFSVLVSDATAGLAAATPFLLLTGPVSEPREGSFSATAGTLLLIQVETAADGGNWRLDVTALAPTSPGPSLKPSRSVTAPRVASLGDEATWFTSPRSAYGRFLGDAVVGEALVCFCEGEAQAGSALLERHGCRVLEDVPGVFCRVAFDVAATEPSREARETFSRACLLASSSCVRVAERNHIRRYATTMPDDPHAVRQWNLDATNLLNAWDLERGDFDVIIAVLDTGKTNHPDLNARWAGGYDFVNEIPRSGDGDGRDPDATDIGRLPNFFGPYIFHGTYVAGIAGASTDNGEGIAGVDWNCRIMPVRISGISQFILEADLINAIRFAARLPNISGVLPAERADVINMSLGSPSWGILLDEACTNARDAGVTLVVAAGNSANDTENFPAAYSTTISVSAVDAARDLAFYSSFGPSVTVAAPGGDTTADVNGDGFDDGVLSCHIDVVLPFGGVVTEVPTYASLMGTSAAAPHVAGIAGLLLAQDPTRTPSDIEALLTSTALDLGPVGKDDSFGAGLVDARAALTAPGPPGGAPPVLQLTPDALSFGFSRSQLSTLVRNGGEALLEITALDISTEDGGAWLLASTRGAGNASQNADEIVVQIDRQGLAPGNYFGEVIVRSTGGDVPLAVAMQVVTSAPPPPNLDILVRALDAETGAFVQEQLVNPVLSLDFAFPALPIGTYVFVASSDVDGDGTTCEGGDYCGGFPLRNAPQTVRVFNGVTTSGVDFDVVRNNTASR